MLTNNINFKTYQNHTIQQIGANSKSARFSRPALSCDTVSFSSRTTKKLGFSSQTLYKANIKQLDENGETKFVPAKIIRFVPDEDNDIMNKIKEKNIKTPYICTMINNFLRDKWVKDSYKTDLLALEIADESKKPEDKIQSLAEVTRTPQNLHLGYKDMKIKLFHSKGKDNGYTGAGEVLLYGICKYAKDRGFNEVTIPSTEDSFYDHLNIQRASDIGKYYYALKQNSMNGFLKKVEEKYQIPKQD